MMSKAELARKAGLSTLTIDRVEAGRPCRLDTKRKILLALGLRVSDKDAVFGDPKTARRAHCGRREPPIPAGAGTRDAEEIRAVNISLPGFSKTVDRTRHRLVHGQGRRARAARPDRDSSCARSVSRRSRPRRSCRARS